MRVADDLDSKHVHNICDDTARPIAISTANKIREPYRQRPSDVSAGAKGEEIRKF